MKKNFWEQAQKYELECWENSKNVARKNYNKARSIFFYNLIQNLTPSDKVLEIGGALEPILNLFPSKEKYSLDPLISHYSKMEPELYKKIKIYSEPAEKMPFNSSFFDVVIMLNVLDHVRDPKKTMSEVLRVLKPKGILIFSVDVNSSLWKNIIWFRKKMIGARTPNQKMHPHHLTSKEIKKWIQNKTRNLLEFSIEESDGSILRPKRRNALSSIQGKKEMFLILRKN